MDPNLPPPAPPSPSHSRPPRLLEWALGRLVARDDREALLGDAEEEFRRRSRRSGRPQAVAWYRSQVLRSVLPALSHAARRSPERFKSTGGGGTMTGWTRDVRWSARSLGRRPMLTTLVVTTLAAGIGTTTALFGVFRAVFLEPIDLPEPETLTVVMQQTGAGCCGPASGPDYLDWSERQRSFRGMAAIRPGTISLTGLDEPRRVFATRTTASVFPMLGVEPAIGRWLQPADELDPGVVVLNHELWQNGFGSRADILGETVEVDGLPRTVVGVMPPGFDIPSPWYLGSRHDLYLPLARTVLTADRGSRSLPVIARLADGVTLDAAQADMDRVMRELAAEYPVTNERRTARVFGVHDYLYGDLGRQFGLLVAAAGAVLLIACGNVAALLLARAVERGGELALRTALGASRARLIRLLFTESALLAVTGGGLGLLAAMALSEGLRVVLPATVPRIEDVGIDPTVLGFAAVVAAATALVFGVVPSFLASRTNVAEGVREGGHRVRAPGKERARDAFIVGQIALGLVLANGAALLVASYTALRAEASGFRAEGVVTLALDAAGPRYDDRHALARYFADVVQRVEAVPGVAGVGMVTRLPLFGGTNGHVWIEGTPPRVNEDEGPLVEITSVAGDYFDTMEIPLLAGRTLAAADSATGAVGVVVNQRFAETAWPDEDPLGRRFSFDDEPPQWLTVVGVVGDVRQWGPEEPPQNQVYTPTALWGTSTGYLTVRTTGDAQAVVAAVGAAVLEVDPTRPPAAPRLMTERVDSYFVERRFYTTLIGFFAGAAVLLAAAGTYGTISYFVARRLRDLGIRIALGAGRAGIVGLVVRRSLRLALAGLAVGSIGILISTSVVEGFVYGIAPVDLGALVGVCVVLLGATLGAAALPAARATRASPAVVLRSE